MNKREKLHHQLPVKAIRVFLFVLLFMGFSLMAQEKFEKEYRAKTKEVPEKAINWLKNALPHLDKEKWYVEESEDKKSFEAKFDHNDYYYSVEFDITGSLEDIERIYPFESLPEVARKNLAGYFESQYEKYSLKKIQQQWRGDPEALSNSLSMDEAKNVEIRYEIEFLGKDKTSKELWKGLFDASGKLIQKRKIKTRTTDHLNF